MNDLERNRVDEICSLHTEIAGYCRMALDKAIRIGELLAEQKASLPHGEFGRWIQEHLPFSDRTVRNYMKLHECRDRLKTETISDLSEAYGLLRQPQLPEAVGSVSDEQATPATKPDTDGPTNQALPGWIPQPGEINLGECRKGENDATVTLVHEHKLKGFVRVYCIEGNDINGGGIIEGFRRGVRIDRVPKALRHLGVGAKHRQDRPRE